MEVPKLNSQQTYLFSSDSDCIASLVPAVSLKFWYMFIIEITFCSFVRLDAITEDEKKAAAEGRGGLVLNFRLFYVSVDHMFSLLYKFYIKVIPFWWKLVEKYMFWIYVEISTFTFSSHLYNSKIVLNGSILLGYYLIHYTLVSTCILTEFVNANFRLLLREINHCPWQYI